MKLQEAIKVNSSTIMAVVGAGGKTSILFQLARQLEQPVVITTTTHMGTWQKSGKCPHFVIQTKQELEVFKDGFPPGINLVTGEEQNNRLTKIKPQLLRLLSELAEMHHVPLLIEADGARQKSLKAPETHEPAIPEFANCVAVVGGLSPLGKLLDESVVHRSDRFSELAQVPLNSEITSEAIARVFCHVEGGLKNIPQDALRIAIFTQFNEPTGMPDAEILIKQIKHTYDKIVFCDMDQAAEYQVRFRTEKVACVILAAGGSSRFGFPKPLLDWGGEPVIRSIIRKAMTVGFEQIIVVTGAYSEQVEITLYGLPIHHVVNPGWQSGLSSSIKAGMNLLSTRIGAVVFLLVDQPQIPEQLMVNIVEAHTKTGEPIICPVTNGQRTHPVLFDSVLFPELMKLTGDIGARHLISRYPTEYLPWEDASIFQDIDLLVDYIRLKRQAFPD